MVDSNDPPLYAETQDLNLTIGPAGGPLALAASPEAHAIELIPYNSQIQIQGGKPPFTWEILQGSLPFGLSFCDGETQRTCTISGTPDEWNAIPPNYATDFTIRVRVRDSNNPVQEFVRAFTITVHNHEPAGFHFWHREAGVDSIYGLKRSNPNDIICWGYLVDAQDPNQRIGVYVWVAERSDLFFLLRMFDFPTPGDFPEGFYDAYAQVPEMTEAKPLHGSPYTDLYIGDFQEDLGILTFKYKGRYATNQIPGWALNFRTRREPFNIDDVWTPVSDWLAGYEEVTVFYDPTACPDWPI